MRNNLLIVALTIALSLCFVSADAAQVTVMWDHNTPLPEGYRVFQRLDGEAYDYSSPACEVAENTCTIIYDDPVVGELAAPNEVLAVWNKRASTITVTWKQPDSLASRTDYFVCRAYEGPLESVDSEEVSWTATKPMEGVVTRYDLFFSETPGGPYTPFDSVDAAQGQMQVTAPLTVVPAGEVKSLYFVVVAFASEGEFSVNSAEAAVEVDRALPPAPGGITIQAVIPVQ